MGEQHEDAKSYHCMHTISMGPKAIQAGRLFPQAQFNVIATVVLCNAKGDGDCRAPTWSQQTPLTLSRLNAICRDATVQWQMALSRLDASPRHGKEPGKFLPASWTLANFGGALIVEGRGTRNQSLLTCSCNQPFKHEVNELPMPVQLDGGLPFGVVSLRELHC